MMAATTVRECQLRSSKKSTKVRTDARYGSANQTTTSTTAKGVCTETSSASHLASTLIQTNRCSLYGCELLVMIPQGGVTYIDELQLKRQRRLREATR